MFNKEREIELVNVLTTYDSIGQPMPYETKTTVIAKIRSISMSEWTNANQLGLSAEYQAVIWSNEYERQEFANIDGVRYHIYRTYEVGDKVELYLERMVGYDSIGR